MGKFMNFVEIGGNMQYASLNYGDGRPCQQQSHIWTFLHGRKNRCMGININPFHICEI